MSVQELRELYGDAKGTTIINRAVKAEIPGGELLYRLLDDLYPRRSASPELEATYARLIAIKSEMTRAIAAKYGLKSATEATT